MEGTDNSELEQHENFEFEGGVDETKDKLVQESTLHKVGKVFDSSHPKVKLAEEVKLKGFPIIYGAQIPVESNWNLDLLKALLVDYHDQEVVEFLRFGWPANRLPGAPAPTVNRVNHKSAIDHPVCVQISRCRM